MRRLHLVLIVTLLTGVGVMIGAVSGGGDDYPIRTDYPNPSITAAAPTRTFRPPPIAARKCRPLRVNSSLSGTFPNVRLCLLEGSCSGTVEVEVSSCNDGVPALLSNNATLNKELRAMGPDTLRVRLAGPEVVAGIALPTKEDCVYAFPFTLNTKGRYNVAVERLYAQFQGINEAFSQWPELLKQSVLPVEAPPSNYHHQQRTLESTEWAECVAPVVTKRPDARCSGLEPTGGKWVEEGGGATVSTRVRVRKIQRNPILFEWAIQPERPYVWQPEACSRGPLPDLIERFKGRYVGKRVVVAGDSQLRALYFGLVNVLKGSGVECVRNLTDVAGEPAGCIPNVKGNHKMMLNGVAVNFYDDLFLDKLASGKFDKYDAIVTGFAQHPASKEHWPFDRYRESLLRRHAKLLSMKGRGTGVVWYLAPQYPHTRQGYPVVVKDWRTDPRLALFNGHAQRTMQASGVPVVDGYRISTPMSHTSPDQAHFSNFVSYEIVTSLLQVLVAM